jgi:NTP pyrophosphatase (non-canonical NTP hydrolase)
MSDIQQLIDALVAFRDEREWQQFHDTKNLAVALSIEAAELNELFLWKGLTTEQLADVCLYTV